MKIGIVCYPTYGGSGVVATELGIALAKKGHEVHFITYNQPVRLNALSNNIHFHEVFVEEYPLFHYQPYELALSSKLVAMVKLHDIELLHVHYAIPHAYAAYMAKQMLKADGIHIPFVTTLHGTDITLVGSHPNYKNAVEFSINNSDAVTVVSESLKKDTLRLFNIKKDIKVIYNFIDFEKYDSLDNEPCLRGNLANKDERIITHISNFRPVKRIPDVIDVFYKTQQKIKAQLLMVGDGPERDAAEKKSMELGIADHVKFLGNSVELAKILCLTDLFLLPSQTESFGLAALEAMAAKTPVISSNSGGLPEVNIEGKTGFLSDVGDTDAMSKNAIYLLSDDERLETFKNNAYQFAKRFTIDKILPEYEEVYRMVKEGCC
ncbi:N-acetyl-alpha-D-glucosaminyl L-malate synthase BshA [Aureibaculum luteum]|uniref:N-acetyl-alpha-D-glucosaminyl L-malate synthase BshA n=1 Tax=Aureibaculum luteum TaxID=1548456 RepID=UPI000E4C9664|nr:N-acetyl-alpha-D-glucosaminyl L-malate synthase BshA [Aureibaculum luteum]